jgi:NAD(P)-dependent dehydrogenase (short-subunit alcohol dehydrogenase family)
MTFALNHMAYFVLTEALRERLIASAPARIVSTASDAHKGARLDFDDLQLAKDYSGLRAYRRSKLANILFTRELSRRLAGGGVTANCLHPGFVATRFGDATGGFVSLLMPLARLMAISPEQGADTLIHLASSPQVAGVTGEYFVKRQIAKPSAAARDDAAAQKLWAASEALAARPVG